MKILHFIHSFLPESIGGTEIYVYELSKAQTDAGHSVAIITPTLINLPEKEIIEGIEIYRVNVPRRNPIRPTASYNPLVENYIRNCLTRLKPDIVHIHHWHNLTDNIAAICNELNIPVIATLQDFFIKCPKFNNLLNDFSFCYNYHCTKCFDQDSIPSESTLRELQMKQEVHLISKIIVPSNFMKKRLRELYDIDKIEVIENSVTHIHIKKHPQGCRENLSIGYWGVIRPNKGVHILLEAIKKLHEKKLYNFNVVILGVAYEIEYENMLKNMAAGLPVTFYGQYDRRSLADYHIDLAVFPSIFLETYCYALTEAFQLGIPVLVPELGTFRERVTGGGAFFKPGDSDDLADKLEIFLSNKKYHDDLRNSIPKQFLSVVEYEKKIYHIYQDVILNFKQNSNINAYSLEKISNFYLDIINIEKKLNELNNIYGRNLDELFSKQAHINNLEKEIESKQKHIDNIEMEIQSKQRHINNLEKEIELKQKHIDNIETEIQSKQSHIENLETDNRLKQQHIDNIESSLLNYQQTLKTIYNSRIWKLIKMFNLISFTNK